LAHRNINPIESNDCFWDEGTVLLSAGEEVVKFEMWGSVAFIITCTSDNREAGGSKIAKTTADNPVTRN